MRLRLFNRIYAFVFGYFWKPCPICGEYFGGHEWEDTLMITSSDGVGICPHCGDRARLLRRYLAEK